MALKKYRVQLERTQIERASIEIEAVNWHEAAFKAAKAEPQWEVSADGVRVVAIDLETAGD